MEIELNLTKSADKFFTKHTQIYDKFIQNLKSFYCENNQNIDIKAMKGHKNLYRMRINDYRVIYSIQNGKMIIISVLMVASRGQVYKKF